MKKRRDVRLSSDFRIVRRFVFGTFNLQFDTVTGQTNFSSVSAASVVPENVIDFAVQRQIAQLAVKRSKLVLIAEIAVENDGDDRLLIVERFRCEMMIERK